MRPTFPLLTSALLTCFTVTPSAAWSGQIRLTVDVEQRGAIPQSEEELRLAIAASGLSMAYLGQPSYDPSIRVTSIGASVLRGQWEEVGVSLHICDDAAACDTFVAQIMPSAEVVMVRGRQSVLVVSDWNGPPSVAAEYAERIQGAHR